MRCEDLETHFLDGLKARNETTLPEGFAEHLEECSQCRALLELWQELDRLPLEAPDPGLGQRFRQRLTQVHPPPKRQSWFFPLAAAALLLAGVALGAGYSLRFPETGRTKDCVDLGRGSASDRLQAIAMVSPSRNPQCNLAEALLERVAQDPSTEVRLSAVEALYLFGSEPELALRLETCLQLQDRPAVQLALVDLLAALRERRAAEALRRLVRDGHLGPAVRRRAQSRLEELRS